MCVCVCLLQYLLSDDYFVHLNFDNLDYNYFFFFINIKLYTLKTILENFENYYELLWHLFELLKGTLNIKMIA